MLHALTQLGNTLTYVGFVSLLAENTNSYYLRACKVMHSGSLPVIISLCWVIGCQQFEPNDHGSSTFLQAVGEL
jgi:hypothetical protein